MNAPIPRPRPRATHPPTRFEQSPLTRQLIQRLRICPVGETVTYEDLSGIAGADVRREVYHLLLSARRRVLTHDGVVFGVVSNVGLRRLDPTATIDAGESTIRAVGKKAKKGLQVLGTVETDGLERPEQERLDLTRARLGLVRVVLAKPTLKALQQSQADTGKTPSLDRLREKTKLLFA